MLPISILERTDHSIIYSLPAGKPDPLKRCDLNEEKRDRVLQQAAKGNTCSYYVLNYIRRRIGKNPTEELMKEREIEQICSARRKAQTEHENSLPAVAMQLGSEEGLKVLQNIDLKKAKYYVDHKEKVLPFLEHPESLEGRPSLFPFIEEFLKEGKCENMHEFLLIKKYEKRNEINMLFLSSLGFEPKTLFETEINQENGYELLEWETLDIVKKGVFLDFLARDVTAKSYGLQKSSWFPSQGIESLIEELKTNGPLSIGGALGRPAYVDSPTRRKHKLVETEIDVYAWKEGAKRHPIVTVAHSILLVGAKKSDQELVYFIDPNDPSDPHDISKQKIYMISFNNLNSHITDLHGALKPIMDAQTDLSYIPRVQKKLQSSGDYNTPYAYFGEFNLKC